MIQSSPILIFQDHLSAGGAARAANRWADVLRKAERPVTQVAGDQSFGAARLLTGKPSRGWGRLVEAFTGKGGRKDRVQAGLKDMLEGQRLKGVWFHNIAGGGKWGWSEQMVSLARQYAPVVWTLHDMWALGEGREGYFEETNLRMGIKASRIQEICMADGRYPIAVTAPSKWLANLATKISGQKCWHLSNPIDFRIYSPGEQGAARRRFGLQEKGMVILAGADSIEDPRKGLDLLLEAWGQGRKDAVLALFGRNGQRREGIVNLGSIDTDDAMADAYRAADLYVHPARQENAPCTIQESFASGTPVLAFPVGGIPEMIQAGENGFLASEVTAKSLHESLEQILENFTSLRGMREKCRKSAEGLWDQGKLLREFEEIVAEINTWNR